MKKAAIPADHVGPPLPLTSTDAAAAAATMATEPEVSLAVTSAELSAPGLYSDAVRATSTGLFPVKTSASKLPASSLRKTVRSSHTEAAALPTAFSRKHGVVIARLPSDCTLDKCLAALVATSKIPCSQFVYASAMNGLFHVYFRQECFALQAIQCGLDYQSSHYDVHPLAFTTVRVTVSNVLPEIPHSLIRSQLQRYGRVLGPIRNLRAATKLPEFSHLFGFRRQAFVEFFTDGDADKLPPRVNMVHDGLAYTLYLHAERPCTSCGAFNHLSSGCPHPRLPSMSAEPAVPPKAPAPPSLPDVQSSVAGLTLSGPPAVTSALPLPLSVSPAVPVSSAATSDPPAAPQTVTLVVPRPRSRSPEPTSKKLRSTAASASRSSEPPDDTDVLNSADDADSVADSVDGEGLMDFSEFDAPPRDSSALHPPPHSDGDAAAPSIISSSVVPGPLDGKRLNQFIKAVKGSPTPLTSVSQYTSDLPGLIQQLRAYADLLRKQKANSALAARIANLARRLEKGAIALS